VFLLLSQLHQPAQLATIRDRGVEVGFREIKKWNIAQSLLIAAKDGQVAQLSSGWRLLSPGYKIIEEYFTPHAPLIAETRHSLQTYLDQVTDQQRKAFLEEAIRSFDVKAYRAAIVLSWVGAMHILQEHVVAHHKASFNSAGAARAAKYAAAGKTFNFVPIKGIKDFGTVGEADILQICQDAGVLHKAEKQVLEDRLNLRNQCGHPNPLVIGEHSVANHLELLIVNVYSKY
jgi:hypothetical protein